MIPLGYPVVQHILNRQWEHYFNVHVPCLSIDNLPKYFIPNID